METEPTVFDWIGGMPALNRMTRIFYEKYAPHDPLLAPLFSHFAPDHPERVAKWLGEVFGGPKDYSEEFGGYSRMLSRHLGKMLTDESRARWVELLMKSADDAGLPNDAEFRSVFSAYIEWGSRIAVENSQLGATPPPAMPMPHWDWHTAAGAPGSRPKTSPVAPEVGADDARLTAPETNGIVSFETDIKPMFRETDRAGMKWAFDLWSYDEVSEHAEKILARISAGTMPPDHPWPENWVDRFARWIHGGKAA
ncbi:MAG TPA: group II truncated hemoglobin [Galbitalea sp.]|jgi:truncated hemoglobin YjbI|nr:group II truncated hemoglobin [Galbitalea sp.]